MLKHRYATTHVGPQTSSVWAHRRFYSTLSRYLIFIASHAIVTVRNRITHLVVFEFIAGHMQGDKFFPFYSLAGVFFIGAILTGCGGISEQAAYMYRNHAVFINKSGAGIWVPESEPAKASKLDIDRMLTVEELQTQLKRTIHGGINEFVQNNSCVTQSNKLRLVLFVHGGLNSYKDGIDHMNELTGLFKSLCYYPLYLNWNSDLGDAVFDDLLKIRFGKTRDWAWLSAPLVMFGRVVSSIGELPASLVHNMVNIKNAVAGAKAEGDPLLGIAGDVLWYAPFQALYSLTIPFGEAFGAPAWNILKRRTDLATGSHLETSGDGQPLSSDRDQEGAARILIKEIQKWIVQDNGKTAWKCTQGSNVPCKAPKVEITLIGHSMGAMILNRLIASTETPKIKTGSSISLPISRVVYLAPASPINEVEATLFPYLERHPDTEFWLFTLNRRDEYREIALRGMTFALPRGSLLSWIDTFLENEAATSQATFGSIQNVGDFYGVTRDPLIPERDLSEYLSPTPSKDWRNVTVTWKISSNPARLYAIESPRKVFNSDYPEEHGSFVTPTFVLKIMCKVDRRDC